MKYYYVDNKVQKGPFSFEEFSKLPITEETLVWHEGLTEWTKAKNIFSLQEIFKNNNSPQLTNEKQIPPKTPNFLDHQPNKEKLESPLALNNQNVGNKKYTQWYFGIGALILLGIVYFITSQVNLSHDNHSNDVQPIPIENPTSLNSNENQNTEEVPMEEENLEPAQSNDYSNWSGTYYDEFGNFVNITGPSSDGEVKFHFSTKVNEICTGEGFDGSAYLTGSAVANYSEEGTCHINFTFNPGQLEIRIYDCFYGNNCGPYSGFYRKR